MGIKSWIDNFILKRAFKAVAGKLVGYLDGKKTALGAVSLLLWCFVYGVPVLLPDYEYLASVGQMLRTVLEEAGLKLDSDLLFTGATLTVVGLLDKLRKYFL